MKGTLKKKIVAVFVAVFMLSTIFVTNAFALGTTISGEYNENGNLVYGSTVGTDDAVENTVDNVADIDVQAKVTEYNAAVYKIDIAWGAMQFEFKNDANNWDPDTHQYVTDEGTNKEWIIDGYVNGVNNKITLTNHSNARVNATFAYAHVTDAFNTNPESADAVRGHFFLDNENAKTAAGLLKNSATVQNAMTQPLVLHHLDNKGLVDPGYYATHEENIGSVYFTLNGTPDTEKVEGYTDFTKVGTITVTITPTEISQ